jgi:hypothetical protein
MVSGGKVLNTMVISIDVREDKVFAHYIQILHLCDIIIINKMVIGEFKLEFKNSRMGLLCRR